MENSPIRRGKRDKPADQEPRWSNMPTELLLQIFALLSVMDRIINVSMVCRSWRSACSDKMFSSTLDLCDIRKQLYPQNSGWTSSEKSKLRLTFRRGINVAGRNLSTLVVDPILEVDDNQFIDAAQRSPNLEHLGLPFPYGITYEGLASAFRCWTNLKSMYFSFGTHLPHVNIFRVIGENCPNFTELKVCASYAEEVTALAITRFLPSLKVLSVNCALLSKDAVDELLLTLKELEELYICIRKLTFGRPPMFEFRPAIMHDQRVLIKAARLRVYHVCYKEECNSCPASTMGTLPSAIV